VNYLKHNANGNNDRTEKVREKKQGQSQQRERVRALLESDADGTMTVDSIGYSGLAEVAEQLDKIHDSLKSYTVNSSDGENSLNLFTGTHSFPVRLELEGDAVETIAESLKRIADAMTAKKE
jgi:hypothetical protein